ncbi:MAG TPA: phytoene/squalene synthase family protein [Bdellovibrionales bacterium]|nr:phytoene/squalene synthase family protein [Bdellovibrionales bacterium]
MSNLTIDNKAVLSKHARSFRWGAFFLSERAFNEAALIYTFCRLVDDIADRSDDRGRARRELGQIRDELAGLVAARPLIHAFKELMAERRGDLAPAFDLIKGAELDLGKVEINNEHELLQYCYYVAGTVGLMMCVVLDVRTRSAEPFAIDLGLAMQITNICRDVREDAEMGRIYVPIEWLRKHGIEPSDVLGGRVTSRQLVPVLREMLLLADTYYRSADTGMRYIPFRQRLGIVVASRLYRAIGLHVRYKAFRVMEGRIFVPWYIKVVWTVWSLIELGRLATLELVSTARHDRKLHKFLEPQ